MGASVETPTSRRKYVYSIPQTKAFGAQGRLYSVYSTMKLLSVVTYAGLVAAGRLTERALSFAKAVEGTEGFVRETTQHAKRDLQQPLIPQVANDTILTHNSARLEIETATFFGIFPFFWTNIAFGTPHQPFRMVLDLGYGGAVVRSEDCTDFDCERGFNYSSNASSTFHDENEQFLLHLVAQFIYGNVSRDHMQLAALNITDTTFGAVYDYYGENWYYDTLAYYTDGYVNPYDLWFDSK